MAAVARATISLETHPREKGAMAWRARARMQSDPATKPAMNTRARAAA